MHVTIKLFVAAAFLPWTANADIRWTGKGTDGDFFNAANWDFSASVVKSLTANAPIDDHVILENATRVTWKAGKILLAPGRTMTVSGTKLTCFGVGGFERVVDAKANTAIPAFVLRASSVQIDFVVSAAVSVEGGSKLRLRGLDDSINSRISPAAVHLAAGAELMLADQAQYEKQRDSILFEGQSAKDHPELFAVTGGGPVTVSAIGKKSLR